MKHLAFEVYGQPAPQGSKRHIGSGVMIESSKAVKPWRESVKTAAVVAMGGAGRGISGPVEAVMIFTVRKPKSAPKRRVTYPSKKPDLDKLVRAVSDALTDAGAWEDDARLIRLEALKVYPGEHPDALQVPGVRVILQAVEVKA